MKSIDNHKENTLIISHHDRCKVCYMCVRECPAKAIRIFNGMSEVVLSRCIGCGNCVKTCSQGAKQVASSEQSVYKLLKEKKKISAVIDPAFPAEFPDMDYHKLVSMIRKLGFTYVHEGAFGADLIAIKLKELLKRDDRQYISTTCPAVYYYVIQYHPDLVESLSPLVSPMIASSRIIKSIYGEDTSIVYIGPCIAKKGEAWSEEVGAEIDEVMTFEELRTMFALNNISEISAGQDDFDPPLAGKGILSAVSGGLLQSQGMFEDILEGEIVTAHGQHNFTEAIKEFESGGLPAKFLGTLSCKGCIMGAGMTTDAPLFRRRSHISKYAKEVMKERSKEKWMEEVAKYDKIDFSRTFVPNNKRMPSPSPEELKRILNKMGKKEKRDELNCRACGYNTCVDHATAIHKGLAEVEMCLPYTIEQLHKAIKELAESHDELARTREALKQSEKLATMGQLSAGIAHELNNPLGVVIMYSHLLMESVDEDSEYYDDLNLISQEADRCKKIVQGLLNFSRKNKLQIAPVQIPNLIDKCLKLVYVPDGIKLAIKHESRDSIAEIDMDQIIQVLSNLINNAVNAMNNEGTLSITSRGSEKNVHLIISDTGCGIAKENITKIYEPFYTTKGNKGTGLGLAVTYGIIKMHRGQIQVESNNDPAMGPTGTTFTIILPRKYETN